MLHDRKFTTSISSEKSLDLSLVLPCYNEAEHLSDSFVQILKVLRSTRCSYEVILVDDASRDTTVSIIQDILRTFPSEKIRTIFHKKNEGRGAAVMSGVHASIGRVIGFIDVDLEVHARYLAACYTQVQDGYDLVVAKRIYHTTSVNSLLRAFMTRAYAYLVKTFFALPCEDTEAGYKFFNRKTMLPVLNETQDRHWFWDTEMVVLAQKASLRIGQVPCLFQRRVDKTSTVKLVHDSFRYVKSLIAFKKRLGKTQGQAWSRHSKKSAGQELSASDCSR